MLMQQWQVWQVPETPVLLACHELAALTYHNALAAAVVCIPVSQDKDRQEQHTSGRSRVCTAIRHAWQCIAHYASSHSRAAAAGSPRCHPPPRPAV